MKKMLLMACALVALTAGIAAAGNGGINLGWNECGGDPSTLNRVFACNTNAGINTLYGSFVAPSCVTAMSANEIVMDVQSAGLALPLWWGMRTGSCRAAASLAGNFDFLANVVCYDYWQGGAIGALAEDAPAGNRARIKGVFALPAGDARITSIPEGTEVYSFKANINNAKSSGLGACAGCLEGVCIVLNSIKINQPVTEVCGSKFISTPAVRNTATWQGGIAGDCLNATPAKNTTWGSVKALYR
jgi:hypothetical protein